MADLSDANFSASMALSKHRICSSSLSKKAFSRDRTVDYDGGHGLLGAVEGGSGEPPRLVVRRQLAHQKLEVALALDATGFQKILHQLEHGDDVSALLGMVFVGRQELSQHQDDRGEQTFGGIVEEGVLPTVAVIAVRVDNGLGQDLGVFFSAFARAARFPGSFRAISMYRLTSVSRLLPSERVGLRRSITEILYP